MSPDTSGGENHTVKSSEKRITVLKKYPFLPAWLSLAGNFAYAVFHMILSAANDSVWDTVMALYFFVLGAGRLTAVIRRIRTAYRIRAAAFSVAAVTFLTSVITYLTIRGGINPVRNSILVIGQAACAFLLTGVAVVNLIKSYRKNDPDAVMIRNLSMAAATGSILSLERTMLGTFGSPDVPFNRWMEAATGAGAFIILLVMSVNLFIYSFRFERRNHSGKV